ncbi:hypothetical protein, conserved [Leishmania tarentolae]|uniref:Uncharacterized protein n=1 Tax=Leishmania tarentolae TaxID=5689 RepID=A0A640KBY0_LEITA|nr:hypothetical protein, conserved [Leishmania tarentolae]
MRHMNKAADGYQRPSDHYRQVATSAHFAAAPPASVLATPIQTRPLQGNPCHPLLWNGSATSSTGTTGVQATLQRKSRARLTSGATTGSSSGPLSSSSSLSTPLSSCASAVASGEGRLQRRVRRDRLGESSVPASSSTTARVLQLQKPTPSQMPPSSSSPHAPVGLSTVGAGSAVTPANLGRERKVMAVNYNALFQQELQQQTSSDTGAWPTPSPSQPTDVLQYAQLPPSASAGVHDTGAHSGSGEGGSEALSSPVTASSVQAGAVEGPLPPDVRRIIAQSCTSSSSSGADTNTVMDVAEQQARRLISTGRRVKVYREELAAAEEEHRDLSAAVEERQLVRSVLQREADDINARIQALLQERTLVEAQLHAQDDAAARETRKLIEAQDRVTVLRKTIEGIVEETSVARLMLRQLVPSLHIENYY